MYFLFFSSDLNLLAKHSLNVHINSVQCKEEAHITSFTLSLYYTHTKRRSLTLFLQPLLSLTPKISLSAPPSSVTDTLGSYTHSYYRRETKTFQFFFFFFFFYFIYGDDLENVQIIDRANSCNVLSFKIIILVSLTYSLSIHTTHTAIHTHCLQQLCLHITLSLPCSTQTHHTSLKPKSKPIIYHAIEATNRHKNIYSHTQLITA